ncbi:MAG: DUF3012 domain-containing protein [Cellvibrionaceae bacterium]
MKKYLGLLCLLLIGVIAVILGLTVSSYSPDGPDVVGSEQWCEAMVLKPNKAWNDAETRSFAKSCLYE